ncbi:hypothetical protein ACOMHN_015168 [Nucella lapillus]
MAIGQTQRDNLSAYQSFAEAAKYVPPAPRLHWPQSATKEEPVVSEPVGRIIERDYRENLLGTEKSDDVNLANYVRSRPCNLCYM